MPDSPAASPVTTQPLLRAQGLFCERDDRVLFSALDFELNAGDLMQVQGSNGSGKTTLLRILCGLNAVYEGELFWRGVPIDEDREAFLASLLYLGHRVGVNKILTARENLRWSCALHSPVNDADIEAALRRVGLTGRRCGCWTSPSMPWTPMPATGWPCGCRPICRAAGCWCSPATSRCR